MPFRLTPGPTWRLATADVFGPRTVVHVGASIAARARYAGEGALIGDRVLAVFVDDETGERFMQYQPK